MKRPFSKSQASTAAMLSAGVFMATGVAAQTTTTPAAAATKPVPLATLDRASAIHFKFAAKLYKEKGALTVAGMLNTQPVFKTAKGEFFQMDPATGDFKFLTPEALGFIKLDTARGKIAPVKTSAFIKWADFKTSQRVTLLGVDLQGHVLQENSRGEKFYLNAYGDMVFVK